MWYHNKDQQILFNKRRKLLSLINKICDHRANQRQVPRSTSKEESGEESESRKSDSQDENSEARCIPSKVDKKKRKR